MDQTNQEREPNPVESAGINEDQQQYSSDGFYSNNPVHNTSYVPQQVVINVSLLSLYRGITMPLPQLLVEVLLLKEQQR